MTTLSFTGRTVQEAKAKANAYIEGLVSRVDSLNNQIVKLNNQQKGGSSAGTVEIITHRTESGHLTGEMAPGPASDEEKRFNESVYHDKKTGTIRRYD